MNNYAWRTFEDACLAYLRARDNVREAIAAKGMDAFEEGGEAERFTAISEAFNAGMRTLTGQCVMFGGRVFVPNSDGAVLVLDVKIAADVEWPEGDLMPRVLITGDRHWDAIDVAETVINRLLARYGPNLTIVHGAATGVDSAFEEAAELLGVDTEPHPADWGKGKSAGPIRNSEMVKTGADLCIAVHRYLANSRGTLDCVRKALAAGIPVWLIDSEECKPRKVEKL